MWRQAHEAPLVHKQDDLAAHEFSLGVFPAREALDAGAADVFAADGAEAFDQRVQSRVARVVESASSTRTCVYVFAVTARLRWPTNSPMRAHGASRARGGG